MPRDKTESHEKILAAARKEFMQYGFKDASMRRIGEEAGLTAAALYRHFAGKEALFGAVVEPAVHDIYAWIDAHVARAEAAVNAGGEGLWQDTEINMMRELVYPRMDEYRLLLNCAAGSGYENFLHDLVTDHQRRMMAVLPKLRAQGYPVREISAEQLHLLLTAYTTALFEPVIHEYSEKEAMACLATVEAFFLPGWKQIFGF